MKKSPIAQYDLKSYGKLGSLAEDFLTYLEIERGRSLKTIRNYGFYLKRFIEFLQKAKPTPADITLQKIKSFRLAME